MGNDSGPRPVVTIAALGLVAITGGAVAGIVYGTVLNGESSAVLVGIASTGLGGLLAVVGVSKGQAPEPLPPLPPDTTLTTTNVYEQAAPEQWAPPTGLQPIPLDVDPSLDYDEDEDDGEGDDDVVYP